MIMVTPQAMRNDTSTSPIFIILSTAYQYRAMIRQPTSRMNKRYTRRPALPDM